MKAIMKIIYQLIIMRKENYFYVYTVPYKKYEEFKPETVIYKKNKMVRMYDFLKQNTWSDKINNEFLTKTNGHVTLFINQ